jgi:hypothetical protein
LGSGFADVGIVVGGKVVNALGKHGNVCALYELPDASLTADASHLVTSLQRMLHPVRSALPGGAGDADVHRLPPVPISERE